VTRTDDQQDAWPPDRPLGPATKADPGEKHSIPDDVLAVAHQIGDAPRHLGIHSGGMVICGRPSPKSCRPSILGRVDFLARIVVLLTRRPSVILLSIVV
jgi:hypothetical protein